MSDRAGLCGEGLGLWLVDSEVSDGGELVLPGELFGVYGDAVQEDPAVIDDPEAIDLHLFGGFALNSGQCLGIAFGGGRTELDDWADGAEWVGFLADGGTELHHRLVVVAGIFRVEHLIR